MKKIYTYNLSDAERVTLTKLVKDGTTPANIYRRAELILAAEAAPTGKGLDDESVMKATGKSHTTVERMRKKVYELGALEAVKIPRRNRVYAKKIDGAMEAKLIALVCSSPPEGFGRWSLSLVAGKMVTLKYIDAISRDTVRRALKKTKLSLG